MKHLEGDGPHGVLGEPPSADEAPEKRDLTADAYRSYRSAFKGHASASAREAYARKLARCVAPFAAGESRSGLVVDLGCGAGELLRAYQLLGFGNLGGCDLSPEQTLLAREISASVATADLFCYLDSIADHSISIVNLFDVIEHLTKQRAYELLRIVHAKLAPGGILVVQVPNGQSPFFGRVFFGDLTHEWCMTPGSAAVLCRLSGYTDFRAKEHLGQSASLVGVVRLMCWRVISGLYSIAALVETGSMERIWTQSFVFSARKPRS